MEKKDLQHELKQKEELLMKTEMIHQQLIGQITLLRELIIREETTVVKP